MIPARCRPTWSLVFALFCVVAPAALAPGGLVPAALGAQTIRGTLLEQGTDAPIPFGRVMMFTEAGDSVAVTLSDADGAFALSSEEPGSFLLAAAALGHRESWAGVFELGTDSEMTVEFRIAPEAIALEGLVIEGQRVEQPTLMRNGFYDRLQQGFGHFITPADLEKSVAVRTQDLFARMLNVRVSYGGVGGDRVLMRGPWGYCSPRLFLDGMRVELRGMPLDGVIALQDLQAVEVYRGPAETPLEYGGIGTDLCGAIVFWTKTGG